MPKVKFISASGQESVVDAAVGQSAMEAAVSNLVSGIDGDCGGSAACGTCHVFVDATWLAKIGPATSDIEKQMLSLTDLASDNSRLACQIKISEDLDGLTLRMPESQH